MIAWGSGQTGHFGPASTANGDSLSMLDGIIRLRTLILIRWIAIGGQATALGVVHFGLGYPLPLASTAAVVAASMILNVLLALQNPAARRLGNRQANLLLTYDLVQLSVLLFLTGGLGNPFAVLILVPVTISATNLKGNSTVWLALLATVLITLLALYHYPLPWKEPIHLPPVYILGVWSALVLGTLFMSVYAWRMARESRRMADALTATHLALAREQRLSAVGDLAAAAAHELGTPLSTIAVAAKELSRLVPADDVTAADVELIRTQALRCREILMRLARQPTLTENLTYDRLPLTALVGEAMHPHSDFGIDVETKIRAPGNHREPIIPRSPEIVHGLGNLIENAVGYAEATVEIVIFWDQSTITVGIHDDGPGFEPGLISSLGEPYVASSRSAADVDPAAGDKGGLGLGVFIAKTLLERTGAGVAFENRPQGGAAVDISWPRAALEGTR